MFRFKLPAILWDSRLNTKKSHQYLDYNVDEDGESSSDVQIIDTPCELSKSSNTSHQIEPYISPYVLPTKVTSTNTCTRTDVCIMHIYHGDRQHQIFKVS